MGADQVSFRGLTRPSPAREISSGDPPPKTLIDSQRLGIIAVLLLGLVLRVLPLSAHRFHEDEALYASWALQTGQDPALLEPYVDKPPLHIYSLVASERLLGSSEEALRIPSLLSSMISVSLVYVLARRVFGGQVALIAAMLFAANPFSVLFAATAFTDSTLVMWVLAALYAVLRGHYVVGGVALGLAYATKQTSVLMVPLVVATAALAAFMRISDSSGRAHRSAGSRVAAKLLTLLCGFVPPFALVTWWDSLRWSQRPSFWHRSLVTYGGLSLAPPGMWAERASDWLGLLRYVFSSPPMNGLLVMSALVVFINAVRGLQRRDGHSVVLPLALDLLLIGYTVGFLLWHVIVEVQLWDRYLLVLVAPLCMTLARGLHQVVGLLLHVASGGLSRGRGLVLGEGQRAHSDTAIILVLVVLGLAFPVRQAIADKIPIGGDHGTYDGIKDVAEYVRSDLPLDATVYYHWSGWHLAYYLHDAPQQLVWYPSAESLVSLVQAQGSDGSAVLVLPDWQDTSALRGTLDSNAIALRPLYCGVRTDGSCAFELVRLEGTVGQSDGRKTSADLRP